MMRLRLLVVLFVLSCAGGFAQFVSTPDAELTTPWKGFGYNQWGFARLPDGHQFKPWDDDLWKVTAERILAIRPGLVRLPLMREWFNSDDNGNVLPVGTYNWNSKYMQAFFRIMDLYKAHGIAVMSGLWGAGTGLQGDEYLAFYQSKGDKSFARLQADLIDYLVNVKSYDNITLYTPTNEPLGAFKDFAVWKNMIKNLHAEMTQRGLPAEILIGADSWGDWTWLPARENRNELSGYDFHYYLNDTPEDTYRLLYDRGIEMYLSNTVKRVYQEDNTNKPVMVTEVAPIGVGYIDWPKEDAPAHCRVDTYEYGLNCWEYAIQLARSGAASGLAWGLDGFEQNKNAGMWNNAGTYGGLTLRHWYYTWQLVCRYFPADARILKMSEPDKGKNVRIAGARIGENDYSYVAVNRRMGAESKVQEISFGFPAGASRVYVYYYNRSQCGNGAELSLPYAVIELPQGGDHLATVSISPETGVLITTLPPYEAPAGVPVHSLGLGFETENEAVLLGNPQTGISVLRATNPRKREPNVSNYVCQAVLSSPKDILADPASAFAVVQLLKPVAVTDGQTCIAFQCYRNSGDGEATVGVKFAGDIDLYVASFVPENRSWTAFGLDLSAHAGKNIEYFTVCPDKDFGMTGDEATEYLYIDNLTTVSSADNMLTVQKVAAGQDGSVYRKCFFGFEFTDNTFALSYSNDAGNGGISGNPRAGGINESEKSLRTTQLISRKGQTQSNGFSVSLNPLFGILVREQAARLHFQVFKMTMPSEFTAELKFRGETSVLRKKFRVENLREWKDCGIDLSDRVGAVIENITFYPNPGFSETQSATDEVTYFDNIVLSSDPVESGVAVVPADLYSVYVDGGLIRIIGAAGTTCELINPDGRLLDRRCITSDSYGWRPEAGGLYILKVGHYVKKIIL